MYRYEDCLSNSCLFMCYVVVGVVPDIEVAYEGVYSVVLS